MSRAVKASPASKSTTSIRQALSAPGLLGNVLKGPSWLAWRTLLIAANGEELADAERVIFKGLTGRDSEPLSRVEELWGVHRPQRRKEPCSGLPGHLSSRPRGPF